MHQILISVTSMKEMILAFLSQENYQLQLVCKNFSL